MHATGKAKEESPPEELIAPTEINVEAVARAERESLHERSAAERFSDRITRLLGSMTFVVLHVLLFAGWAIVNLGVVPGLKPFDPFPFGILTLIVSTEGVFIAIFILISQNRMSRQADRRNHLNLQMSMLAEQEITTLLKMQERVCAKLGVDVEPIRPVAERLMAETDIEELLEDIKEKLPNA
jgi:uncharacterized membrane protein